MQTVGIAMPSGAEAHGERYDAYMRLENVVIAPWIPQLGDPMIEFSDATCVVDLSIDGEARHAEIPLSGSGLISGTVSDAEHWVEAQLHDAGVDVDFFGEFRKALI